MHITMGRTAMDEMRVESPAGGMGALAAFPQVARSLGRRPKWLWVSEEGPSKAAVDEVWKTVAKKCAHRN